MQGQQQENALGVFALRQLAERVHNPEQLRLIRVYVAQIIKKRSRENMGTYLHGGFLYISGRGQQAHSAQPGAGGAVKGIWPPLRKLFCHAQHLLILGKRKARSLCGNRTGTKL
ncbi:hypothetical protein D3Z48_06555 [Clostridiaceae bacterium]|nr:hypothetical protein [Clostridiaceae bacterium]